MKLLLIALILFPALAEAQQRDSCTNVYMTTIPLPMASVAPPVCIGGPVVALVDRAPQDAVDEIAALHKLIRQIESQCAVDKVVVRKPVVRHWHRRHRRG